MLRARQLRRRDLPAEGRRKENPFAAWLLCANKNKISRRRKVKLSFAAWWPIRHGEQAVSE